MKKLLFTLCLFTAITSELSANTGDTTWVTIYNSRKITQYGNYDTSAVLPTGKRFRKIRLHYILGRYACPAGTQYCGSWDYTTQVYVKPAGADTVEIARVITPYATDWLTTNRKHDYIIDVTDYAAVLNGNLDFRYIYQGYSWGFTVTLKLEMIEGIPPMDAYGVKNIYDGYFSYGNISDPIENHLVAKPFQYNSPSANAFIKNTISGHGSDDNGCGEFCSKYYELKINNTTISQKQLWRNDCGMNDIYPQTGTWLYERANWCPGAVVKPITHNLSAVTTPASTFSVDIDMEPYAVSTQTNLGGFNVVSQLINYSAPNYSVDVAIEDIIAPTDDPNYFRSNNVCSNPKVKIKNVGTTAVTSVVFNYNLVGGAVQTFTWTGNLPFLKDTIVDLGPSIAVFNGNNSSQFVVSVSKVNGVAGDQNPFNDTYQSAIKPVKSYPSKFVVFFSTNAATSPLNPGFNEAHWKIIDQSGTVVASRVNNLNSKVFKDTLTLPNGCYTFIADDDGCDGISWWVYPYYTVNPGTGTLKFSSATSLATLKTFNGDFGCQIIERFTVGYALSVNEISESTVNFQLFPNPSSDAVNMLLDMSTKQDVSYVITDITGKQVYADKLMNISSDIYPINTTHLVSGLYFVTCKFDGGKQLTQKLIINK
jgi:hypothetical protein